MQTEERIAALSAIFACPVAVARALDARFIAQRFAHRETIAHQGDPVADCWLVIEGTAEVHCLGIEGQRAQLMVHGPGELFGAFPEPMPSRGDIVANGALLTLRIPTRTLAELAQAHSALGAGLAAILARQLDFVLDRMAARTTLTAAGRVYAEILRLGGAEGRIAPPPVLTALALRVQTTRETASRAVAALERRGIIRRDGEALTILSPRLLQDLIV